MSALLQYISFFIPLDCRCNKEGTIGNSNVCEKNATNGACSKKPGCNPPFTGNHCDSCEIGYYKLAIPVNHVIVILMEDKVMDVTPMGNVTV